MGVKMFLKMILVLIVVYICFNLRMSIIFIVMSIGDKNLGFFELVGIGWVLLKS